MAINQNSKRNVYQIFSTFISPYKIGMLLRLLVFISALILSVQVSATHNRAGEITYEHVSGNTYKIIITTYTKISAPADRQWMYIDYGDESALDSIERVMMIDDFSIDTRTNVYYKNHTYPGPGVYTLLSEDPNRVESIINLGGQGSVNIIFVLETVMHINPVLGVNNSAALSEPPLDNACVQQVFQHNPGAYDIDGDSLSYALVPCLGAGGVPLNEPPNNVYVDPDEIVPGPDNVISIDPITGTLTWDSPQQIGLYNIAILITEYRENPITGEMQVVGTVLRDMQINVGNCNNNPPSMSPVPDLCVEAGTNINFQVNGSDPNGDQVTLTATGLPFDVASSPASYNQIFPSNNATFNWNTNCSHVRLNPYQVVFKAKDNNPSGELSSFSSANITIVAPAPENPAAEAALGEILLNWDESPCSNATGYKIYRRAGLFGFNPDNCETGVPEYTGYELLAEIQDVSNTTFLDNNDISFGINYCYMVVACFPDGAESYASEEFCAQISAEIPLITHNSVGATDAATGIDTVRWQRPFDLDTMLFAGPYQYRLYRGNGFGMANELIFTSAESSELSGLPGEFIVNDLNTSDQAYTYRVELQNAGEALVSSSLATSIFLTITPNDEQLTLNWQVNQPWINFNYRVEQFDELSGEWVLAEETEGTLLTIEGLENGEEYCFRIVAEGSYFNEVFADTLINLSQEVCAIPFDNTPPCAPVLDFDCNCDLDFNSLSWSNTNESCGNTDDTEVYYIYYAPFEGEPLVVIDSVFGAENTTFEHLMNNNSLAGCYAVSALDYDEVNDRRNESALSNLICCDNCPDYQLPNVFTPNSDGENDLFIPFPYRFVDRIELVIYNRWGQPVFETEDPDIRWDGIHMESGVRVPDGVYYYIATVHTIRLSGIVPIKLTGNVHLLGGKDINFN